MKLAKLTSSLMVAGLILSGTISSLSANASGQSSQSEFSGSSAKTNSFWWPEQLNLSPLRQHSHNLTHTVKTLIMVKLS